MKEKLKNVKVAAARELNFKDGDKETIKCILITVPYPSLADTQKNIMKLQLEIEKKKNAPTFFIGLRTIVSKRVKAHASQMRPRNRTLTAVHDAFLEDLLYPAVITGRRIRYTGARNPVYKVTVNEESRKFIEPRVNIIKALYAKLTNRQLEVSFKSAISFVLHRKAKKTEAPATAAAPAN